jgi:hypothetical protein
MALLAQHALPHVIATCGMPRAWCATMHPAARSPIGPVRRKDPLGNAMAGSVSASASTATRTWDNRRLLPQKWRRGLVARKRLPANAIWRRPFRTGLDS